MRVIKVVRGCVNFSKLKKKKKNYKKSESRTQKKKKLAVNSG